MKLVKEIAIMLLFMAIVMAVLLISAERAEKINNGELTVVSEEYMDR